MKFLLILTIIINFSFAKELENKINDFFINWDNAHNNKNVSLFDKLYLENANYYNGKNFSKIQILEDKIKILNKYLDFRQISKIISKERISNEFIKVNYEKNTFYSNKNKTFNSYLILDSSNEQLKIFEENDNKTEVKSITVTNNATKTIDKISSTQNNNNSVKTYSNKPDDWKDLRVDEEYKWKNLGITNPNEAKEWLNIGVNSAKAKELIQMNYKPIDLKDYSPNILNSFQIKMLKDLNMKSSPLIESMATNNSNLLFRINFFETKEKLTEYLNILTKSKCQKIEKIHFYLADEYDNEDLCYFFDGALAQRLSKTEGLLASSNLFDKKEYINYVIFDKPWSEGDFGFGIIKGMGSMKYETISSIEKLVRKGKVIILNIPKLQ